MQFISQVFAMLFKHVRRVASVPAGSAVMVLAARLPALGQCAMCRTVASAQEAEAASALNFAILILLAPAVVLFSGIFVFAVRYRNESGNGQNSE